VGELLSTLGAGYINLGEAKKAIEYLEQALVFLRQGRRGRHFESLALSDLGLAYYHLGQPKKAITHYEQAAEIAQRSGTGGAATSSLSDREKTN
jgi:tetratricopeptide (TPR) repeat protein